MAPLPPGLILLTQPGLGPISAREVEDALPDHYRSLPRSVETIDLRAEIDLARRRRDFSAVLRAQEAVFRAQLKPRLERHPDYLIVYFGNAPVPLAMHLGFLLGTLRPVEVFLHHHSQRRWSQTLDVPAPTPLRLDLPDERDRTPGEAVIRVSTSHRVEPTLTQRCVADPLVEIDVGLVAPREDAFSSGAEMAAVADDFKRALDTIADRFTRVHRIHVFASVQPGVALLMGTRISDTMHPGVQTYQYDRTRDPPHYAAIEINAPPPPVEAPLTEDDQRRSKGDRRRLAEALQRLVGLSQRPGNGSGFPGKSLLRKDEAPVFSGVWRHLPGLAETPLARTSVDEVTTSVPDSFKLEDGARWQLDDRWLARLARLIPDEKERLRALRLLVLHESVHRGRQGLTTETSAGVGRFARVLEVLDYEADVWALVHEFVLAREEAPRCVEPPAEFFAKLILTATKCMWAFDEDAPRSEELQVRRLHRYLIWYWQCEVLLHHGAQMSIPAVLDMLAERPTLELAGPELKSQDERVFFLLDHVREPELAIYDRGALHRLGEHRGLPLSEILEGMRHHDGERVRKALRGAVVHTKR